MKQGFKPSTGFTLIELTALTGAEGFHRDALQVELAVGLLVFSVFSVKADAAKVMPDAKKALREIYSKAGYACATPQGEDYKTVLRRISAAADLYQHIGGRETIVDWIGDASPRDQVKTIMEHVKNYKFDSINDVLAYVGKPVVTKRPREGRTAHGARCPRRTPTMRTWLTLSWLLPRCVPRRASWACRPSASSHKVP